MNELRDTILACGVFQKGEITYSNGQVGNNKLEMDKLWQNPEQARQVLHKMGELATGLGADCLIGIPNGALVWGEALSQSTGIPHANLQKLRAEQGDSRFAYRSSGQKRHILEHERIVIVEDVSRTHSNFRHIVQLSGLREKIVGLVSIWHRGERKYDEDLRTLKIPFLYIVDEYIPEIITDEDIS